MTDMTHLVCHHIELQVIYNDPTLSMVKYCKFSTGKEGLNFSISSEGVNFYLMSSPLPNPPPSIPLS